MIVITEALSAKRRERKKNESRWVIMRTRFVEEKVPLIRMMPWKSMRTLCSLFLQFYKNDFFTEIHFFIGCLTFLAGILTNFERKNVCKFSVIWKFVNVFLVCSFPVRRFRAAEIYSSWNWRTRRVGQFYLEGILSLHEVFDVFVTKNSSLAVFTYFSTSKVVLFFLLSRLNRISAENIR